MVAERRRGDVGTATRILDVAERLAQVRGFNGFSYADIAAEVGITKAALHYHFASKADLGKALISRYAARFGEALAAIDTSTTAARPSCKATPSCTSACSATSGCACAECWRLSTRPCPSAMQASVVSFFDQSEAWLQDVLEQGRGDGSLHFTGPARDVARMIISCLEGAMLVTRPYGDIPRFQNAAASLMTSLTSPSVVQD